MAFSAPRQLGPSFTARMQFERRRIEERILIQCNPPQDRESGTTSPPFKNDEIPHGGTLTITLCDIISPFPSTSFFNSSSSFCTNIKTADPEQISWFSNIRDNVPLTGMAHSAREAITSLLNVVYNILPSYGATNDANGEEMGHLSFCGPLGRDFLHPPILHRDGRFGNLSLRKLENGVWDISADIPGGWCPVQWLVEQEETDDCNELMVCTGNGDVQDEAISDTLTVGQRPIDEEEMEADMASFNWQNEMRCCVFS